MIPPRSLWLLVVGVVALSSVESVANADEKLLQARSPVSVLSVKDRLCVVSENTGLSTWYSPYNHGFSSVAPDPSAGTSAAESEIAMIEHMAFGGDHQLVPNGFACWSLFDVRDGAGTDRFVSDATTSLGAEIGFVFGKDGECYLSARIPKSVPPLVDDGTSKHAHNVSAAARGAQPVPEPSAFLLFGSGAALLALLRQRRRF